MLIILLYWIRRVYLVTFANTRTLEIHFWSLAIPLILTLICLRYVLGPYSAVTKFSIMVLPLTHFSAFQCLNSLYPSNTAAANNEMHATIDKIIM